MPIVQPVLCDITDSDIAALVPFITPRPDPDPVRVLRLFNERHADLAKQLRPFLRKPRKRK